VDARTSLLHGGRITYLGDPLELSFVDWSSTREEAGVRGEAGLLCGLLSFFLWSFSYVLDHRYHQTENPEYLHPPHHRRPREIAELPTHRNPLYLAVSSPNIRRQSEHEVIVRVFNASSGARLPCLVASRASSRFGHVWSVRTLNFFPDGRVAKMRIIRYRSVTSSGVPSSS